jgi:hypothetical protein
VGRGRGRGWSAYIRLRPCVVRRVLEFVFVAIVDADDPDDFRDVALRAVGRHLEVHDELHEARDCAPDRGGTGEPNEILDAPEGCRRPSRRESSP